MRRVETMIEDQCANSDHNAWMHTWKTKRRLQSTKGVSDKPLCANALSSCQLAPEQPFREGKFRDSLPHFRTLLANWMVDCSHLHYQRRRASQVGRQSSITRAELKLVLSPSARRVEVVLVVSQGVFEVRGGREGKDLRAFRVCITRRDTHDQTPLYCASHSVYT